MENFILRPWRMEDAPALARYANDPGVAENLRDAFPCPYSLTDAEAFIRSCLEADPEEQLLLAVETAGEAVGSVGLFRGKDVYRRSAELGYWLGQPFWRRGIMSRAVGQVCDQGFSRWDIVRIYAEPYARNAGSRRVLEKAGFQLEGILHSSVTKNGELLDSCMYALLRSPL